MGRCAGVDISAWRGPTRRGGLRTFAKENVRKHSAVCCKFEARTSSGLRLRLPTKQIVNGESPGGGHARHPHRCCKGLEQRPYERERSRNTLSAHSSQPHRTAAQRQRPPKAVPTVYVRSPFFPTPRSTPRVSCVPH